MKSGSKPDGTKFNVVYLTVKMNSARWTGIAFLALFAVVGFTLSDQSRAQQEVKTDVRLQKGNTPGGVTLFGTSRVTPVPEGLQIATFGAG